MKKRVLSILLCVIMLCGLLPTAALATTDSGGEDSGQPQSGTEISFVPQEGASLTVNDGIITFTDSESVFIGTVQVYMGNSTDAYTEYLPTELPEARLAIPEGTETAKIVLKPEGDLEAQLVYSGDIREAGAISGPVINEDTYTYTIIVANIPENDSGSKFVGITVEFGTNPGGGGNGGENTNPGGEDSGQTTSTAEISFVPQEGASLTVNDDGIITFTDSESVSIGTVQVYMGNSTDAYTEYLPTELPEARLAIPEGTETVKIVLEPEGDLQAQLAYGGDIREAGAISDPVINEGTYTYTIIVANIPENDSGSKFVGITVEFGTNLGGGGNGGENTNPGGEDPGQPQSGAEISFGPQEGASLTVNDGIITFTDSESVSIGTVQVYMGNSTDAYTEYQIGGSEARLNIPKETETVKIVLKPADGLRADLIIGGDTPEGALSDPVFDETAGTYTFTATPSKFNNGFLAMSVWFGTGSSGGGGNGGEDTNPSVPSIPTTPDTPTDDEIDIPISGDDETIHVGATVSGDTVTVDEIDMDQLDGILGGGVDTGTVTIDFSGLDSAVPITTIVLPANVVKEIAEAVNDPENDAESLEIVMPSGVSITFDADALSEKVSQADGADITISIESHEDADLTVAQKDAVGSRPAFDINVTSGGEHISDIGGKITIGAPYELKNNEKENGLVVWYVDNEGNRERCQGNYDPINKRMNWETNHLSLYMIDYCPSATFADLDIDAWYTDSTDFVIANGLMNGIGDDKFDPDGTTSRAMIVTILWRLEGEPVVNSASVFNDVENGQWYSDAIAWANMNGIVEGYDGKFDPTGEITREQFATILWRYAKYKGYDVSVGEDTNILSYEDAFSISEYAIPAMQWACGAGLMQGDGVNLTPKADATRAQAAALFQRFCENVAEK